MSIYIQYGSEHHDEYTMHGIAKCKDEAQVKQFMRENEYSCLGYMWHSPATRAEYVAGGKGHNFEAEVHERMVAANIAAALRRKRLARAAYKAPTLASLWPTGA